MVTTGKILEKCTSLGEMGEKNSKNKRMKLGVGARGHEGASHPVWPRNQGAWS